MGACGHSRLREFTLAARRRDARAALVDDDPDAHVTLGLSRRGWPAIQGRHVIANVALTRVFMPRSGNRFIVLCPDSRVVGTPPDGTDRPKGSSAEPNFTSISVPVHRLPPEGWNQTASIARNHSRDQAARFRGTFFLRTRITDTPSANAHQQRFMEDRDWLVL